MWKILLIILCMGMPTRSFAWGFYGHRCINYAAVFCLPEALFAFYKVHLDYITEASTYPDRRRYAIEEEGPRHYIDTEFYLQNKSIDSIPHNFLTAQTQFDSAHLHNHGILPYHIIRVYRQLVYAFQTHDLEAVLRQSAELGHYVGDLHVPLHTTENYNGQLTNQHGIHGLWETRIPELTIRPEQLTAAPAQYVSNITEVVWTIHKRSFELTDSVLHIEKLMDSTLKFSVELRNNKPIKTYSDDYVSAYDKQLNYMVLSRLKASVLTLGSLWYSAWIDAGQPDLNAWVRGTAKHVEQTTDSLDVEHDHYGH